MTASIAIPVQPGSAAKVREFLDENLRLDSMRAAEAALLATELVANAIRHGGASSAEVWVDTSGVLARVGVSHPAPGPIETTRHGLGFTLLERLAHSWGTDHVDGQLHVWFDVRQPGSLSMPPGELSEEDLIGRIDEDPMYVEELVNRYRPLAISIARRYRGKGVQEDDLDQVAIIALLKAVHRFDADRGNLRSFAAVTVAGELKRQLRDRGWSVRVPRGLQEQALAVARTVQALSQESGRSPTVSEIASALELSEEEVSEALSVVHGYTAVSLDDTGPDSDTALSEFLGEVDGAIDSADTRSAVTEALAGLSERDRTVVYLRFYEDMTQSEIADRVGVSQMQVSRILNRALAEMEDLIDLDGNWG